MYKFFHLYLIAGFQKIRNNIKGIIGKLLFDRLIDKYNWIEDKLTIYRANKCTKAIHPKFKTLCSILLLHCHI